MEYPVSQRNASKAYSKKAAKRIIDRWEKEKKENGKSKNKTRG